MRTLRGDLHFVPDFLDRGLLCVPLSFGSAHRVGDHRPCQSLSVTLCMCADGVHISSAVISTRLRRAPRDNAHNDE
jgi:hypothetical protein